MKATSNASTGRDRSRQSAPRRARFRREDPQPIQLTADDLLLIRHVARHRLLRSTHLLRLLSFRSRKKLIERLSTLFHNGYLDRPRAQLDYYWKLGSTPMVYGLGNKGAAILAEEDRRISARVDWTEKNRTASRQFIAHTLMIADLMVALEVSVHHRPDVRIIEPDEILSRAPDTTRSATNPWKLPATIRDDGARCEIGIIPDKVFGLDFHQARKRSYFFLEADRGTMPIMRANLRQTSFHQKILGYLDGGSHGNEHGRHFGVGNFRVLTVTTSRERLQTMLAALMAATHGQGSRQFLFADEQQLRNCPDVLTLDWITGRGEPARIDVARPV
jgi:hypothetical protein